MPEKYSNAFKIGGTFRFKPKIDTIGHAESGLLPTRTLQGSTRLNNCIQILWCQQPDCTFPLCKCLPGWKGLPAISHIMFRAFV
ncbi:hypothetical protein CO710_09560 [Acetobacter orleanensis]|nr:hypothetical protein CO710_09560 [Acetobacter orleanensis]